MIGPSFLIVILELHCWVTIDDNWLFFHFLSVYLTLISSIFVNNDVVTGKSFTIGSPK